MEDVKPYFEKEERFQEIQRQREVAGGLRDILARLNSDLPLPQVLDYIAILARKLLATDAVAIYKVDSEAGVLRIQAAQGLDAEYVANMFVAIGYGVVGQAVVRREPVAVSDLLSTMPPMNQGVLDPNRRRLVERLTRHYRALLGVPLIVKGETYGGFALYYEARREFTEDDIELATMFATETALAIENAHLRAQVEQAAVISERTRLTRDLHDSVTQLLYSLMLLAEAGHQKVRRGEMQPIEGLLTEIGEIALQALKEMRLLVHERRPLMVESEGLVNALNQRFDAVERRVGIKVDLQSENWGQVPVLIEEELYYIVRETLNNALKHANATSVMVRLRREKRRVELEVSNNGHSFDPALASSSGGLGLISMRERTEVLGGQLTIRSAAGQGTTVHVRIPLPA